MTAQTSRQLAPDVRIPHLGFGTFLIPDDQAADAVSTAIGAGYRHLDTAEIYKNERGVGEGLRRGLINRGLNRDDVFVTTKLWPGTTDDPSGPHKSAAASMRALDESLDRLGLDFVDLYLIHAPFSREQRIDQWTALVELARAGRTRAVGVSNFGIQHLEELAAEGLPLPSADQVELHPWDQKRDLVEFLNRVDITPIAYSSLVPLSSWRLGQGSGKTDLMQQEGGHESSSLRLMADRYGVQESQLLLRWGVQNGYPVLPKSTKIERMKANADIFSFTISSEDMMTIRSMDRGQSVAWGTFDPTLAD